MCLAKLQSSAENVTKLYDLSLKNRKKKTFRFPVHFKRVITATCNHKTIEILRKQSSANAFCYNIQSPTPMCAYNDTTLKYTYYSIPCVHSESAYIETYCVYSMMCVGQCYHFHLRKIVTLCSNFYFWSRICMHCACDIVNTGFCLSLYVFSTRFIGWEGEGGQFKGFIGQLAHGIQSYVTYH